MNYYNQNIADSSKDYEKLRKSYEMMSEFFIKYMVKKQKTQNKNLKELLQKEYEKAIKTPSIQRSEKSSIKSNSEDSEKYSIKSSSEKNSEESNENSEKTKKIKERDIIPKYPETEDSKRIQNEVENVIKKIMNKKNKKKYSGSERSTKKKCAYCSETTYLHTKSYNYHVFLNHNAEGLSKKAIETCIRSYTKRKMKIITSYVKDIENKCKNVGSDITAETFEMKKLLMKYNYYK